MEPALWQQACTHSSYTNEHPGVVHNERLEWLGDAVLQLIVSEHLYRQHPSATEAELTRRRSALVCNAHLATQLSAHDLSHVRVGESMRAKYNARLVAGVYEALVGAAHLSGLNVSRYVQPLIDAGGARPEAPHDAVSRVQELEQGVTKRPPVYAYDGLNGCRLDTWWGTFEAVGGNKKEARRAAAHAALNAYPTDA